MIPIRLKLQNFMSYKYVQLDFSGLHTFCLAGANGSGKSTILDAMTWALFGEARARNEDLIRLGEEEARVEFKFSLENSIYSILRSYRKGRGGSQTSLEFQVQFENQFRALSGRGVRPTQEKIEEVLRMNYKNFVHSSFILQGQADAFTKCKPSERKAILSDILELGQYEKLQELAKKEVQLISAKIEQLWEGREKLEEQVKGKDGLLQRLWEVENTLKQVEEEERECEEKIQRNEEQYNLLWTHSRSFSLWVYTLKLPTSSSPHSMMRWGRLREW
jgi:exonuclease SbcC